MIALGEPSELTVYQKSTALFVTTYGLTGCDVNLNDLELATWIRVPGNCNGYREGMCILSY